MINGRYDAVRKLGSGGSGDVYLVFDRHRGTEIAMKVMKSDRVVDINRIRHEFEILRRFNHPNLVRVYDFGQIEYSGRPCDFDHRHFYTMEYLQGGRNAMEYFDALALSERKVILLEELFIQTLFALDRVHREGIIHFDIKPENIFILPKSETDEPHAFSISVKLGDFGFSSTGAIDTLSAGAEIERASPIRGTIGYIAPELLQGDPADVRIDLYALGAAVYRLWSNQCPYQAETPLEALRNALATDPPSLQSSNAGPSILPGIVLTLISKDPKKRGTSAWDVLSQFGSTGQEARIKQHLIDVQACNFASRDEDLKGGIERCSCVLDEFQPGTLERHFRIVFGENTVTSAFTQQFHRNYGGRPGIVHAAVGVLVDAIPLHVLRQSSCFESRSADLEERIARGLSGYITRTANSLTVEERVVLEVLSCFEIPAAMELLGRVMAFGPAKLDGLMDSLQRRGCIGANAHHCVSIKQERLREYLYNAMTREKRIALHERISRWWTEMSEEMSGEERSELARHHELSGNQTEAGLLYEETADAASSAGRYPDAARLYSKATAVLDENASYELRLKEAETYGLAGENAKAAELWTSLLAKGVASEEAHVHARKELGKAYARLGENSQAVRILEGLLSNGLNKQDRFEVRQELIALKTDGGFFDDALALGQEQRKLASELADRRLLALVENDIGIAHFYKGNLQESFDAFNTTYALYAEAENTEKAITALNNMGNVLSAMGETRRALESWNEALKAASGDVSKLHQQGMLFNNIGIAHFKLGEFQEARIKYERAEEIFDGLQEKSGIAYSLTNIGEVEFAEGNLERAIHRWQHAMVLYREMQDSLGIGQTLLELASAYLVIGDVESAREHLENASGIARKFDLVSLDPFRLFLEAEYAASTDEPERALESYALSEERFRSVEDAFTGGTEKPEQRVAQIRLRKAELYLSDRRPDMALNLLSNETDQLFSLSPSLQAEREYILGKIARNHPAPGLEHPLIHFKRAMAQIGNNNVTELTWKISLELGREFKRRGNAERAREFLGATGTILKYFASGFDDDLLRSKYLASESRRIAMQTVLNELSTPHEGVVSL